MFSAPGHINRRGPKARDDEAPSPPLPEVTIDTEAGVPIDNENGLPIVKE